MNARGLDHEKATKQQKQQGKNKAKPEAATAKP